MKKWAFIAFIMVATTIGLFIVNLKQASLPEVMQMYEEKWDIKLPVPDERETIWHPESSFFGDGEYVNAYSYDTNPYMEQGDMWPVVEENIDYVNGLIEQFINQSIEISKDNQKLEAFDHIQTDAEAKVGDYFFYTAKNRGRDYFIALYKHAEQKLYTFEWHQ